MVPQLKTKNKPQKIGKPEQWKTKMSHYSKMSARLRKCQDKKTFFFFKKGLIILDVLPPLACCFMFLWSVAHKCWCTLYYRGLFVYEGGGKYQKPSGQWARLIWAMWWHKKWQIFEKSGEYLRRTRQKSNHNRLAGWEMGTTQRNDVYRVFTLINWTA